MGKTFAGALCSLLLSASWSCRTVGHAAAESARTDTVRQYVVRTDSVCVRDSVWIREKGDTVLVYKTRYRYRDRLVRDTAYVSRTDTVRVPADSARRPGMLSRLAVAAEDWLLGASLLAAAAYLIRRSRKKG